MENVRKLLDQIKEKSGAQTNYRLAKVLDLPACRISDYYKSNRAPDEFACLKIADALGMDLQKVIVLVKIDAEKDEKRRLAWKRYAEKLGGVAATLMLGTLTFVILIMTPNQSNAEESAGYVHDNRSYTNYTI